MLLTCKMETETVKRGSSSREMGSKRESFKALVSAYSFKPECKFNSEKVPMHPRNRRSRPVFQVTKRGLRKSIEMNQFLTRHRLRNHLTMPSWRCPRCWVQHGDPDRGALCEERRSRRSTFLELRLFVQFDSHLGVHGRWCFVVPADSRNVHFGVGRTFYLPSLAWKSTFHFRLFSLSRTCKKFHFWVRVHEHNFGTNQNGDLTKRKNIEQNSLNVTLEFHQINLNFAFNVCEFFSTMEIFRKWRTRGSQLT